MVSMFHPVLFHFSPFYDSTPQPAKFPKEEQLSPSFAFIYYSTNILYVIYFGFFFIAHILERSVSYSF